MPQADKLVNQVGTNEATTACHEKMGHLEIVPVELVPEACI